MRRLRAFWDVPMIVHADDPRIYRTRLQVALGLLAGVAGVLLLGLLLAVTPA